jgi:hypothetical protein
VSFDGRLLLLVGREDGLLTGRGGGVRLPRAELFA